MMADEYDLHLDRSTRDRLWSSDLDDFEDCEDTEALDKLINEEMARHRRRKPRRKPNRNPRK